MRLGLLGDIHGNDLALAAVLSAAKSENVDTLLVTGDLIGYYHRAAKVMEFLESWEKFVVRGNHEDMLINARSDTVYLERISAKYGTGLKSALEQLDSGQLEFLCKLPHPLEVVVDGCQILLCHGSPWDNNKYIYPDAESSLLQRCAIPEYDLVVLGHTHYPMCHQIGQTLVVNPGSVGQPRNRIPGAHWAIFDTESRQVTQRNETYDIDFIVNESRHLDPALSYLADVLKRT